MRTMIRDFGVMMLMVALPAAAPASDSSKNLAPDFTNLPEHVKVVVAPPDVELFEISAGGVPAPRGDWSTEARQLIHAEIERRRGSLGVDTVELDEATADELGELLSLHAAVAQSIALHQFGGIPLPTKNGQLAGETPSRPNTWRTWRRSNGTFWKTRSSGPSSTRRSCCWTGWSSARPSARTCCITAPKRGGCAPRTTMSIWRSRI